MPLLLYCVTGPATLPHFSIGVSGRPVLRLEDNDLAIYYSENESSDLWLQAPVRTSAAEFHRVQRDLFRSAAILTFRFPTILKDLEKLREHLAARSSDYKSLLHRFATCAQMDIALTYSVDSLPSASGAAYLRDRQTRIRALEQFANSVREQATPFLKDWRQRTASNGLRCFALLERKQVQEFNERIKGVAVPQEVSARVSGPWPVAEFLDLKL